MRRCTRRDRTRADRIRRLARRDTTCINSRRASPVDVGIALAATSAPGPHMTRRFISATTVTNRSRHRGVRRSATDVAARSAVHGRCRAGTGAAGPVHVSVGRDATDQLIDIGVRASHHDAVRDGASSEHEPITASIPMVVTHRNDRRLPAPGSIVTCSSGIPPAISLLPRRARARVDRPRLRRTRTAARSERVTPSGSVGHARVLSARQAAAVLVSCPRRRADPTRPGDPHVDAA